MKFFRKARFQLIEKGITSKYLKYAFGEILLVVIGILIALKIDNLNEVNKENTILNEYLVKIKSHLEEDQTELDTIITYRRQMGDVCKKARMAILTNKEDENLYTIMASGVAFADFYFKAKTDGYEALKNSSSFGKINNTTLDSLFIQYYSTIEIIAENEKSYNDYILTQEAHISKQFDRTLVLASAFMTQEELAELAIPQLQYYEVFKAYSALPAYRNVINLAAFQFDSMVKQYEQLQQTGKAVIDEILIFTRK